MDKNQKKIIIENEKRNFSYKINKIISNKKGIWFINIFAFLLCCVTEFIFCKIFKMDFNLDFQPVDKSDFKEPDKNISVVKAFFVVFLLIILLIISLKLS